MAIVFFYEKPGCSGNARQKALLEASGHTVLARDILTTPWTRMQLLAFLQGLPIPQWFNRNAPMITSGEVNPDDFYDFDASTVLSLLQANPILIRRPLLEIDGVCRAGFDIAAIDAWIGLPAVPENAGDNLESCRGSGEDACSREKHHASPATGSPCRGDCHHGHNGRKGVQCPRQT